jgi:hypothetical protein
LLRSEASTIDFKHAFGGYRTKIKETPEAAIAYPEDYVRSLYAERRFVIAEPIHYRSWPSQREYLSYQDLGGYKARSRLAVTPVSSRRLFCILRSQSSQNEAMDGTPLRFECVSEEERSRLRKS